MNIFRALISMMAFFAALMVGFKTGSQINLIEKLLQLSSPGIEAGSLSQVPNTQQFNLVLIGATDMDIPNPQLESIWLAAYSEITHKMTFIPVFPSPNDPDRNLILAGAFSLEQGKPSKTFWKTLRTTDLWWDGYILSDRITAIEIVDMIDGIYVDDTLMNGEAIVNQITSWKENPQSAVENQGILLAGICSRAVQIEALDTKSTWEMLINNPANSDFHTILEIAKWGSEFRENQNLTCEFPMTGEKQAMLIQK